MILPLALFAELAAACAPSVHVDTLAAVAATESGFHPFAIHDNRTGRSFKPRAASEAVALATALSRHGHSLDLGLMQVNSANLAPLGMSVADAFNPCRNLAGGARVLSGAYDPPAPGEDAQPRLVKALSRYNTGHPTLGVVNGYVRKVQASAERVVPAIRVADAAGPAAPTEGTSPAPLPSPPPSWDVYGQALWRRTQILVAPPANPSPPVRLQARMTSHVH